MAIRIFTEKPKSFVTAIRTAIDDDQVRTWDYDAKGRFNHTAPQWSGSAVITPSIVDGKSITFLIQYADGKQNFPDGAYAVFQGRFVEMLTQHFGAKFAWLAVGKFENLPG